MWKPLTDILPGAVSLMVGFSASLFFAGIGCDESLPAYEDPRNVLRAGVNGLYVLGVSGNYVLFFVEAVNSYDETLEGQTDMNGQLVITLGRDPAIVKTFDLGAANLITTAKFNSTTGVLRMDPGDTIRFRFQWNLVDDNGLDLRSAIFEYFEDPSCSARCIAAEEVFAMKATIQVYTKIPDITTSLTPFSLCHVSNYISPQFCIPIDTSIPCSVRPRNGWVSCP